ncbi:hypothetical protein [Leifsonia sp. fls2-241-R2A-40a]|uniref:hypothetical protein n=1 Tax=Leifsonia sp. fls2-241-R2A-40a TaxID=3040290 RepID=UPI0025504ED2|nr:hypothetical protein [Leifsonia sp. fls2-241-R2A-40a]
MLQVLVHCRGAHPEPVRDCGRGGAGAQRVEDLDLAACQAETVGDPGAREKQFSCYLAIGAGNWDGRHRPSFVRLDRVFRVQQSGMRREGAALDVRRFDTVRRALAARYGWR